MNIADTVLNLKAGETITLSGIDSQPVDLCLNIGDALMNGDSSQVWLENSDTGKRLYLRRKPEKKMSIGLALFPSLVDLAHTLETGNFYIG